PSTPDAVVVVNQQQLLGAYHLLNEHDVIAAGQGAFVSTDDEPARVDDDPPHEPLDDAYLVDDQRKVAYRLQNRSTTVGRDVSNGIVVRDPRASRFHAEIRREAGGFALHTMGSAGTSLNGEPMRSPRVLAEDDAIEIAFAQLRFTQRVLPQGITAAVNGLGMNDQAAVQSTAVGPRSTMESAIRATEPPKSMLSLKVAAGFAVLVLAALAVRFFAGS
ncbi:MAG: FHA domain-containing protein, partial [Gemmatimonadaceae bacterium]